MVHAQGRVSFFLYGAIKKRPSDAGLNYQDLGRQIGSFSFPSISFFFGYLEFQHFITPVFLEQLAMNDLHYLGYLKEKKKQLFQLCKHNLPISWHVGTTLMMTFYKHFPPLGEEDIQRLLQHIQHSLLNIRDALLIISSGKIEGHLKYKLQSLEQHSVPKMGIICLLVQHKGSKTKIKTSK